MIQTEQNEMLVIALRNDKQTIRSDMDEICAIEIIDIVVCLIFTLKYYPNVCTELYFFLHLNDDDKLLSLSFSLPFSDPFSLHFSLI